MSDQKIYPFRYFWKSNSLVLMGTILLMVLLTSCVPQAGAAQPQTLSHANEIGGYIELVDALRTQSVTVEPSGTINQPFFSVQVQVMKVNGIEVQVFEFADELTREAAAAQISPDGSSIGTTMVTWMDQPNFWARGRVIVLYVGQDAATLELLTTVLGAPIARGGMQEGESSLVNTRWILVSFGWPGAETQASGSPVLEGSTITLDFIAGGLAGGSGGCNSYTTQYKVQERSISFAQVISTLIACEEGIDQQEQRYYQALESAQEYELSGDHLVIWYDGGQGVLYFVRESESTGTPTPTPTPYATAQPTSTPTQPANQPTPSPERINFQAGATSATVTGNLPASGSDFYVLRALEGQSMMVELSFSEGRAILAIWGEDGTILLSDHAEFSSFRGVLPSTQDYYILVKGRPEGNTAYSMKITIPPLSPEQPTPSPERINFQTGAISARVTGSLPASGSDVYVLRALGGQTMMVELSFTQGQAILAIWGKDGTVLLSDHAEATRFQGVLPTTQDYFILLKGRPDGETDYGMEVVIPPLPSN